MGELHRTQKPQEDVGGAATPTHLHSQPIRQELVAWRIRTEQASTRRLKVVDGELPESVAPAALSRLVMAITQGMAEQAKAGASRAQLREMADAALAVWRWPLIPYSDTRGCVSRPRYKE
jgi:hypothetical protein